MVPPPGHRYGRSAGCNWCGRASGGRCPSARPRCRAHTGTRRATGRNGAEDRCCCQNVSAARHPNRPAAAAPEAKRPVSGDRLAPHDRVAPLTPERIQRLGEGALASASARLLACISTCTPRGCRAGREQSPPLRPGRPAGRGAYPARSAFLSDCRVTLSTVRGPGRSATFLRLQSRGSGGGSLAGSPHVAKISGWGMHRTAAALESTDKVCESVSGVSSPSGSSRWSCARS